MKICKKCQEEKSEKEFSFRSRPKNWLSSYCKECMKIYQQNWALRNKKQINQKSLDYYYENKEHIKTKQKEWYSKNRSSILKRQQEYVKRPDVIVRRRKVMNRWVMNRIKNDPSFRIRRTLSTRIWHALKGNCESKKTIELLGCGIQNVKTWLESKFQSGMSWNNYGEWHIDHIIPCNSFDLTKKEEQLKCFHHSNLQPLWKHDNLVKSDIV